MRLIAVLIAFILAPFAHADVDIYWESKPSKHMEKEVKDGIMKAAELFKTDARIADLGFYDFEAEDDRQTFHIINDEGAGVENIAGAIFIPRNIPRDYNTFMCAVVHELNHSYDYWMVIRLKQKLFEKTKWAVKGQPKEVADKIKADAIKEFRRLDKIYRDTHKRSQDKEELYIKQFTRGGEQVRLLKELNVRRAQSY